LYRQRFGSAGEARMQIITIVCRPKDAGRCKYTVTANKTVPIEDFRPPETEMFKTFEEAEARAKQLQLEFGGTDKAKIVILDYSGLFIPQPSDQEISSDWEVAKAWAEEG
jgi:hypothetical protein